MVARKNVQLHWKFGDGIARKRKLLWRAVIRVVARQHSEIDTAGNKFAYLIDNAQQLSMVLFLCAGDVQVTDMQPTQNSGLMWHRRAQHKNTFPARWPTRVTNILGALPDARSPYRACTMRVPNAMSKIARIAPRFARAIQPT
jgi:hypothetical protein